MRRGMTGESLFTFLKERQLCVLTSEERSKFTSNETVHAFAKKATALEFNISYMLKFPNVIYRKQNLKGRHAEEI